MSVPGGATRPELDWSALTIRPLETADLPAVMGIEPRAYSHHWSEGIFRDCYAHLLDRSVPGDRVAGYVMPAMLCGEQLLGYAVYSLVACEAHLLNITVAPEFKGRGLGRCLLDAIVEDCRGLGAEVLFLEVRPSNRPAIALYENSGFVEIGIRKDYYPGHDDREDARVMALKLVEGGL